MKLKGSAKNSSAKTVITAAAILGLGLLALRVFQSLMLIDPATGFFTDHKNITVFVFYAFAVAAALLLPLIAYLAPLSKAEYIAAAKRPVHALGCFALAAGVCKDFIDQFASGERTRLVIATVVIGAVAGVALLLCGVAFLTGKEIVKKARLLYAFPALWGLCRTVSYFTIYASYIKNSALLLSIFADVFLMIFLFEYGKKITGLGGDGNSPAYLSTALVSAVFQLCTAVTGAIGLFRGEEFLHVPFAFYRVCAVVFCLSAVGVFLKNNVPDYEPAKEIETHPLAAEGPEAAPGVPEAPEAPEAPEVPAAPAVPEAPETPLPNDTDEA